MKIKTAEEFLKSNDKIKELYNFEDLEYYSDAVCTAMIEFAKYHVTLALQSASSNAELEWDELPGIGEFQCVNKESILNAYSLNNIQ